MNKDCKLEFFLNDLSIKEEEFYNILKIGGIKPDHDLMYFNRRKLAKLLHLSGEELYELIRETTGSRLYQERRVETVKILEKTDSENQRTSNLLAELERKVDTLKQGKVKWSEFNKQDTLAQSIRYLLYERKEQTYDQKIVKLHEDIVDLNKRAEDAKNKMVGLQKNEEEMSEKLKNHMRRKQVVAGQQEDWLKVLRKDMGDSREALTKEIRGTMEFRQMREKKLKEKNKNLKKVELQYQKKLKLKVGLESKIENAQKENERNIDTPQTYEETQDMKKEKELKELDKKIRKLEKTKESINNQQNSKIKQIKVKEEELETILSEFKAANHQTEELKEEKYKCMIKENELGLQRQQTNEEIIGYRQNLEAFYKRMNILAISNLVKEAHRTGIPGVIGVVAELIQITSKDLLPMFEVLFKENMFSIIVEAEKDCLPLIKLNKDLKGSKVKIIPLEWFDIKSFDSIHQSKLQTSIANTSLNETRDEEVVMFTNCYDIRPELLTRSYSTQLTACLFDMFKKGVIVRNVEQAFEVSKTRKLACVTPDLQVIFAGGYLTKAGYKNRNKMHLSTFHLYQEKVRSLIGVEEELQTLKKTKESIKANEEELSKAVKTKQNEMLRLQTEIYKLTKGKLY